MKYIYSTSQMSKLSLILCTFSITGSVASLFLTDISNKSIPHDLEPAAISYSTNQLTDPQLWNGNFCLISIFSINKYLNGNAKNIVCSLYRIATFVRQRKLEDKTTADISQITEFGFAI